MWINRAHGVEYVNGTKDRLTVNNYSPETLDLHQGPSLPPILSRSRRRSTSPIRPRQTSLPHLWCPVVIAFRVARKSKRLAIALARRPEARFEPPIRGARPVHPRAERRPGPVRRPVSPFPPSPADLISRRTAVPPAEASRAPGPVRPHPLLTAWRPTPRAADQ